MGDITVYDVTYNIDTHEFIYNGYYFAANPPSGAIHVKMYNKRTHTCEHLYLNIRSNTQESGAHAVDFISNLLNFVCGTIDALIATIFLRFVDPEVELNDEILANIKTTIQERIESFGGAGTKTAI